MPTADSPATASSPQGAPRLRWEPTDRYAAFTYIAVGGVLASSALAIWGLPVLDLHGPLHRLGIMDFLCGGTRAAYFTTRGRWAMAWYYNPLGPLAVIGAAVMTLRAGVGLATRRWLAVEGGFRGRSRAVLVAGCVAAVALTVRQQLLVDVLL